VESRRKETLALVGLPLIAVLVIGAVLFNQNKQSLLEEKKKTSLSILKRDQGFPVKPINGSYGQAFVVDDFILEEIPLGAGYYSVAAISATYLDAQKNQQSLIIPIAVRNNENNMLQINGKQPRSFNEAYLRGEEKAWSVHTGINKGQIVFVSLDMPSDQLVNNSTQGFGFETMKNVSTARYTQSSLEKFYQTGNPNVFKDRILWPVVHIFVNSSLNTVDPNEPIKDPIP
jgi:hypothetical protein